MAGQSVEVRRSGPGQGREWRRSAGPFAATMLALHAADRCQGLPAPAVGSTPNGVGARERALEHAGGQGVVDGVVRQADGQQFLPGDDTVVASCPVGHGPSSLRGHHRSMMARRRAAGEPDLVALWRVRRPPQVAADP